jgi:hypothetical protein
MCSFFTGFPQATASGKNIAMVAKCTGLRSKYSKRKKNMHTHTLQKKIKFQEGQEPTSIKKKDTNKNKP